MFRPNGLLRAVLTLAVPLLASLGINTVASASPQPPGCVVTISHFTFQPSTAPEGTKVVLALRVSNCTGHAETVTLTQFGTEPRGCPIIDPIARTVTIKADQSYRSRSQMTASPCAGTEQMTLRVGQGGQQLASKTADLTVT